MSERRLEQREIDLLIEAIRAGRIPTGTGSLVPLLHARKLDLRDPAWGQDRIVRRRLGVLDLIFDRLGPLVQITLTKNLRFPVRTEIEGVGLQKFGDFCAQGGGHACLFEIIRLDPLRGSSMIVFESSLIYALIDALMGGLGVGEVPSQRDLSEIEVSLLYKVRNELLRDFENAWKPWFPMSVEHLRSDRNINVISSIADEEVCHVGKLFVSGDVLPRSPLFFIHPYSSLEPLFEATSARRSEEVDPSWRLHLEQNLRGVPVSVSALLGSASLPMSRLRELAPGDLIELETPPGGDIDVCAEGEAVLQGRVGQNHSKYAVQVTQLRNVQREVVDRTAGQVLVRKGLITREQLQVARVDERINRRPLLDSIVARGWAERRVLERALGAPN
jgi:flagellar motor switch protein FliM